MITEIKEGVWINAPETTPTDKVGFVYVVKEIDTNMVYYGIKKFWQTKKLKPLKGKKNKRHRVYETDWRNYKTSSPLMQFKIEKNPNNYLMYIMDICESITEMKAKEAYHQLRHYVNNDWDSLYNEVINLRLRIRK